MSRPLCALFALLACTAPLSTQQPPSRSNRPTVQRSVDTALYSALKWREIGPFRGGRVTAVAGHEAEPFVYYFGATGGGVWKTTDGGTTWTAVTDSALGAGSIGAIAVAPSDANVVYVGTGESPLRGNTSPGDGMYKSTDAGKTWRHIGLRDAGQIADIEVHPKDENVVYAAVLGHAFGPNAMRGVFRSKDGGRTWDKILFRSDSAGAIDLAMDPMNPRILYAAFWQVRRGPSFMSSGGPGSGLFKTTDGGETWTEITRNDGLPSGIVGKIGVTVSPVDHERVWAIVEAEEGGVFRSDDGGKTWRRVNEERNLRQRAWYYTHIHADPANVDAVYVMNVGFFRSVDGGRTFRPIRTPHGDNHALWIAHNDAQRMINGNDGGANVSFDGGTTWTRQDNQPTAQFYHVTTTSHFPYRVCGAQQDNTTMCIASRTSGAGIDRPDWYPIGGCESGYISARRDDPDVTFAGCYHGLLERHDLKTGQERNVSIWPDYGMGHGAADLKYRWQWTFPIVHSPQNPNVLYAAANVLFKSTDDGQSWTPISTDLTRNDKSKQGPSGGPITKDNTSVEYYDVIFAVAPSPHDSNTIWAGTDDGLVHITRDGGKTWTNVTPKARDLPEWALISIVEASPHDPATAYVAATRYKLDDFRPYIYKTTDYGQTWRRITTGIPDNHFIRVVREDPVRRGLLYAGGEFGVYVSFDDGATWQPFRQNLPVVPIHDLVVKDNDLIVATHGRSFWILDDVTPLHQLTPEVMRAERHLFKPRDVWRVRGGGGGGGGGFQRRDIGQNPPNGAVVFAYFKQKPEGEVTLEFLDARDSVVRRFSTKPRTPADSLKIAAGMNRFVWNLRYPDASRFEGMILWGGGTQGPVAVPGTYKVRLTGGSWGATQSFAVKKDPRVTATEADLQRQFDLLISIRNRLSDANDAVRRIRGVKEQLDVVAQRARRGQPRPTATSSTENGRRETGNGGNGGTVVSSADLAAEADSLKAKLSAIEGEIYQVKNRSNQDPLNYPIKINNRISWLAGVVGSADAAPTDPSMRVFEELSAALQVQLDKLKTVLETDVPAFNRRVREMEVPALTVP